MSKLQLRDRLAGEWLPRRAVRAAAVARRFQIEADADRPAREYSEQVAAELRRAATAVHHWSLYDGLTGLGNRLLLAQIAKSEPVPRVLVLVDLDGFTGVNTTFGYATGDVVLKLVADLLRVSVRSEDELLRVGDDEFAALLSDADEAAGRAVADCFLGALEKPVEIDGQTIFIRASVVVAVAGAADSLPELMRHADASMRHAKRGGRTERVLVLDPGADEEMLESLALGGELRAALARHEFVLNYQPIIELETRRVAGFEALVRWQRPGHGLVAPQAFIPLAEQSGLMPELGEWILREACHEAKRWSARRAEAPYVSVNLSVRQLQAPDFVERFRSTVDGAGLPPEGLIVEVTETAMASELRAICAPLEELRQLGVRVYVDDFGTGYSSLGYIRDLPLDGVKLDRAFARDLTTSVRAWALARAVVELLEDLELALTAEGVESAAQLAQLRSLGCHHAQGFYFARPQPASAIDFPVAPGAPEFTP